MLIFSPAQSLDNFKIRSTLLSEAYSNLMFFDLLCQVEHYSQIDHLMGFNGCHVYLMFIYLLFCY